MPAVLDRLSVQLNAAQDRYRAIEEILTNEDRDPNEAERAEMTSLGETMRSLQPRIEEAVGLERSLSAGTSALGSLPVSQPGTGGRRPQSRQPNPMERFRSWGEYSSALATPGGVDPAVMEAIDQAQLSYMTRDKRRAIVDVTTPDVPGLVPPIWVTTIVDLIGSARPFVEAFSQLPLPNTGMVVNFPHIATKPLVGKQTTEKTDVASRKTTVTSQNTNVLTYGGGEDVSIQVIQRTDPAYLGLMNELYAEEMALIMDADAIAAATASITGTAVTLSAAAPAAWNNLLAQAVATMYQNSRRLPDVFVAGTGVWGAFAGAADTTGRPLFPNVSPFNPVGSMTFTTTDGEIRGMTFAVDPNMAPASGIIGNRDAFTTFLGPVQTMSVDNPTKLGRDYAVFQFAAFAQRRPDAAVKVVLGGLMLTSADLKQFMGITSTDAALDQVVDWAVAATNALVLDRCEPYLNSTTPWPATVDFASKLQGARLVKRRASPEGVSGFGDFGPVRVASMDPDIEGLISSNLGLAFA